jgi:hypothetical protein
VNFRKNIVIRKKINLFILTIPFFLSFVLLLGDSYSLPYVLKNSLYNNPNRDYIVKVSWDTNSISDILPAKIQMIYDNKTYEGKPVFYIYRGDESFSDFQVPKFNISNIDSKIINLKNSSKVLFNITGYPPIITPSYLGVTAYKDTGESAQIIKNEDYNKTDINDTNTISLKEGQYTLIATATWDGASEDVEGFQLNAFKINIINNDR